jgi:hypothetical protein
VCGKGINNSTIGKGLAQINAAIKAAATHKTAVKKAVAKIPANCAGSNGPNEMWARPMCQRAVYLASGGQLDSRGRPTGKGADPLIANEATRIVQNQYNTGKAARSANPADTSPPPMPAGWSYQWTSRHSGVITHTWQQQVCAGSKIPGLHGQCWMETVDQQYNTGYIIVGGARTGAAQRLPASDFLTPDQGKSVFASIMLTAATEGLGDILAAAGGTAADAAAGGAADDAAATAGGSPPQLSAGRAWEAQQLNTLKVAKNTTVWRPTADQMNSAAFRVIVGEPKFTPDGLPMGVITDSIGLELKGGGKALESSYQLRLMTYRALVEGEPLTILSTRVPNASFAAYLSRWGVTVQAP